MDTRRAPDSIQAFLRFRPASRRLAPGEATAAPAHSGSARAAGRRKAVLETLGIPYTRAIPAVWKRHYGLLKQPKDAARLLAIRRFPSMADDLKRKKDNGRADALLLALWHESSGHGREGGGVKFY